MADGSKSAAKSEQVLVSREQWLGATKRRFAVLNIANLGRVRIRSLTEFERSEFERTNLNADGDYDPEKGKIAKRALVVLCVVDAGDNPVLTLHDIEALGGIDGQIIGDTFEGCRIHCGFEKKDFGTLKGN